jgi:hypothetical protein
VAAGHQFEGRVAAIRGAVVNLVFEAGPPPVGDGVEMLTRIGGSSSHLIRTPSTPPLISLPPGLLLADLAEEYVLRRSPTRDACARPQERSAHAGNDGEGHRHEDGRQSHGPSRQLRLEEIIELGARKAGRGAGFAPAAQARGSSQ